MPDNVELLRFFRSGSARITLKQVDPISYLDLTRLQNPAGHSTTPTLIQGGAEPDVDLIRAVARRCLSADFK